MARDFFLTWLACSWYSFIGFYILFLLAPSFVSPTVIPAGTTQYGQPSNLDVIMMVVLFFLRCAPLQPLSVCTRRVFMPCNCRLPVVLLRVRVWFTALNPIRRASFIFPGHHFIPLLRFYLSATFNFWQSQPPSIFFVRYYPLELYSSVPLCLFLSLSLSCVF